MSQALRRASGMRIIALPLTTGAQSSGRFTYYHFQTPPRPSSAGSPNLIKRTTGKVADIWAGFGKAPEGSWKRKTFKYGQRLIDRVEFEELALKSIDPSLGPKIHKLGDPEVELDQKAEPSIPLVYPASLKTTSSPLAQLSSIVSKRTPMHRKWFYTWMAISPLTAPFMIIPVIPNLPFFFCAWRSWSHYSAYKASAYLDSLIKQGTIIPEPNVGLDEIYEKYTLPAVPHKSSNSPAETAGRSPPSSEAPERLLLSSDAIPQIVNYFDLPSTAAADLYRALDQTAVRLTKGYP